jgi:hypothetical protein
VSEAYFGGYGHDSTVSSFSVAKPVVSALVGIAFAQRHLLTMSSGLADLDLRAVALRDTRIAGPAGRRFHYNNVNPILLGMVLERTAGRTVSAYLSQQLWGRWAWRPTVPGAWTAAGRAWSCCRPASTAGPSTSPSSAPCTSTGAPGGDGSSCRGVGWPSRPGSTAAPTPPPPSSSPHHNLVLVRLGTDYHYDHWPDPLATLARRLRT